jgi:galactonate dehydratase
MRAPGNPDRGDSPRITGIRTLLMQAGALKVTGWGDPQRSTTRSRNWLFVQVETDAGITGLGEGSGWPRVVEAAVRDLAPLLVGEPAFDIERLHQKLQVAMMGHGVTGTVGAGAIAALDTALWDIKGKALGVPVWQLLGGRLRERVRIYTHASTPAAAQAAVAAGITGIKTGGVADTLAKARAIRDAVGPAIDLMIDAHGPPWLTTADAAALCDGLAELSPLFVEEPVAPENLEGYRRLRAAARVPLAGGERLGSLWAFRPYLAEGLFDVVQPDMGRVGITVMRKLAALAEAGFATLAPHAGSLGPVAEVAALHVMAAVPNALIFERMEPDWEGRAHTIRPQPILEQGYLRVPDAPGLGVEIDADFVAAHPSVGNVAVAVGGYAPGTEAEHVYFQPRAGRAAWRG